MEQLGSLDAVLVYVESKALPLHMGAVLIYDPSSAPSGSVSFDQILANLTPRMDAVDVFRRRVERVPLDLDHCMAGFNWSATVKPGHQIWLKARGIASNAWKRCKC